MGDERERDNPEWTGKGRVPEKPTGIRDNLASSVRGVSNLLQGQQTPEETTSGGVCMCNPFTWEREWTGSFLDPPRG